VVEEQQNQCRKRNDEYARKFRKPDVAKIDAILQHARTVRAYIFAGSVI